MTKSQPSIITRPREQANKRRIKQLLAEMRNNPLLAIELHDRLGKAIPKMPYPELYIEVVHDDGDFYPVMRCPRCKRSLGEEEVVAVDVSIRDNPADYLSADDEELEFDYSSPEENFLGLYYKHDGCGPIAVPAGWEK